MSCLSGKDFNVSNEKCFQRTKGNSDWQSKRDVTAMSYQKLPVKW